MVLKEKKTLYWTIAKKVSPELSTFQTIIISYFILLIYRAIILKWVKCVGSGMDMRNEAREREERGKEGEKMERSKLIVRIPLLQKCGAEMSTDATMFNEMQITYWSIAVQVSSKRSTFKISYFLFYFIDVLIYLFEMGEMCRIYNGYEK